MDEKLQLKLIEKYPIIFKECGGDSRKTCMAFGIECGSGWFTLIDKMCEDIIKLIDGKDIEIVAEQVKEKFGGLRFYHYVIKEPSSLTIAGSLIRQYMFARRYGTQYWAIVKFRRKFYKTIYEKISDIVEKTEKDSYKICETCGDPGKARGQGWIKTSCNFCDKKFSKGKRPWEDNWNEI
jgi:hypothetical protein